MKMTVLISTLLMIGIVCGCKKSGGGPTFVVSDTAFAKGADVSWISQMEGAGYQFYTTAGTPMDGIQLMGTLGINTIRLRVWVNPLGGWNGTTDVVAKAARARKLGLRVLIDFHYSDTWADPGHQAKPAAWSGSDFATLTNTVYTYTKGVLDTLKMNGVVPTWVQVGNETDNGMLWPDGMASTNMANFAALINAGYKAVKEVNASTKVIVHISNGYNNATFRWMFDGLKANGANWDIIGMSLYPTEANWKSYNAQCLSNMNDMVSRYNTPVMICELGMSVNLAATCDSFITDLISKTRSVTGGKGLGVFYWEPECYNNWQGYGLGAFDNTGKPTVAMNAFAN